MPLDINSLTIPERLELIDRLQESLQNEPEDPQPTPSTNPESDQNPAVSSSLYGALAGKMVISDDFDEPLPEFENSS